MDNVKKVLLVEDKVRYRKSLERQFKHRGVAFLMAKTLEEGLDLFQRNADQLDAIIMDACVNKPDDPDSMELIRKMRIAGYSRPIIAYSSSESYMNILVQAGASHKVSKFRPDDLYKILEV
jgi:DNA-binding response OmpR family regulator